VPQYGMVVYSPAPADPMALSPEHLALLDGYPEQAKALRGKVLGGNYFAKQRGFAFDPSSAAVAVQGDAARAGTLLDSNLVVSAFYVVAAPDIDVAVEIAKLHPAARDGGIEVRPLFVPAGQAQDDYAD
jgi:YCII-related domain